MTLHAQYLKIDYKSSVILYYKSYAILGLVTSFHSCTNETIISFIGLDEFTLLANTTLQLPSGI